MPNYAYQGLDRSGKQVAGQIAADDEPSALARIKAAGVFPTDLRNARSAGEAKPASSRRSPGLFRPRGVSHGDLTVFSRQLANLVSGGLPLMRTFTALTEHTENPNLKAALQRMQQDIKGGKALWEALELYPKVFPTLYISMVRAGEASGQLSTALKWLADFLEKEQTRKTQIRSALAYPALLVTVGTIAVTLLILLVVPKFVTVFQEFGQALPVPTVILLSVSGFMLRWWWAAAIVVVGLACGLSAYSRVPGARYRIDWLKLRIPLFGKLGIKSSASRFARTTATLLQGGVSLFDAMAIVREVVGNEVLARGTDQVRAGMREGESFAQRLEEAGVFPPLLAHMSAIGEETGDLRSVLINVADAYDVEVDALLKSLVSLIEPLIIITVGGAIAFIIMAMLLPIFQLNLMGGG